MSEREYWLGFSAVPGMGPAKFRKLLEKYGSAKSAWKVFKNEAPRPGLAKLGGDFSIEDYLKELKKKSVWFVTLLDDDYPQLLKEIKNPPFVLYGCGNKEILNSSKRTFLSGGGAVQDDNKTIAVVGARKTTEYGREVTKLLTNELTLNGFTIISGLALGVDAISHMTALESGGRTIAVLGCGVDCCSPGENLNIYNDILKSGNCIVSEFPLGMKPTKWSFPARNRIIAGLSEAVLVTEGAEDSGSLITGEFALKFGRKVFAVPGPITSQMSRGPYKLITKGAKLVTSADDILKELKSEIRISKFETNSKSKARKGDTKEEQVILDLLRNETLHFDELVRKSKFNSSKLSSLLSLMEIKGMIKSLGNGTFSL